MHEGRALQEAQPFIFAALYLNIFSFFESFLLPFCHLLLVYLFSHLFSKGALSMCHYQMNSFRIIGRTMAAVCLSEACGFSLGVFNSAHFPVNPDFRISILHQSEACFLFDISSSGNNNNNKKKISKKANLQ